jgi:hypothetical protein
MARVITGILQRTVRRALRRSKQAEIRRLRLRRVEEDDFNDNRRDLQLVAA